MINQEQIMGFVRHGLTVGGGVMIAKGVMDEGTMSEIVGALMTLIGFVWSYWAKRHLSTPTPVEPPSEA